VLRLTQADMTYIIGEISKIVPSTVTKKPHILCTMQLTLQCIVVVHVPLDLPQKLCFLLIKILTFKNHKIKSRCLIVKNTTIFLYYIYKIYMYSGRWCFADQLHISALYIGHHQVEIINLIGNYTNVHG